MKTKTNDRLRNHLLLHSAQSASQALLLSFFIIVFAIKSPAQNVTIVESSSNGHVMDTVWRYYASQLGMNATIVPQSAIYNTSFFTSTDILIISSGVIILTDSQITTIEQFLESGKNIYLQGEYDCAFYNTNSTFETMVNSNGGIFSTDNIVTDNLVPMDISGVLSTTPNPVDSISYFWWGCAGTAGAYVEPYMRYNNQDFGFIFCPPQNNYGRVVYNSDQDWVQSITSPALLENILSFLASGKSQCSVPVNEVTDDEAVSIYPNPSSGVFMVEWINGLMVGEVSIDVVNTLGQKVFSSSEKIPSRDFKKQIDLSNVARGIYFVEIKTENEGACPDFLGVRKKILIAN
jgi:hypothetical protein